LSDSVTVFAPGSVSNVGPGFDCLGIAIDARGDLVTARRGSTAGVRVTHVDDDRIPLDPARNTAALAAQAALRRAGADDPLELSIRKGLPLAGGLGGSAASAVGGAAAAEALLGLGLPRFALIECAIEAETVVAGRHADNVAPSLLGGAVLVARLDPLTLVPLHVDASLGLVLATPDYQVETARARAVLPAQVARPDAVQQAANLAMLLVALARGDGELMRAAVDDRIAEPARRPLYPGYAEARAAALEAGALAVAVSGAGPTVVAIVRHPAGEAVRAALVDGYARVGLVAQAFTTGIDTQGARLV
jgi:homoserine kinase